VIPDWLLDRGEHVPIDVVEEVDREQQRECRGRPGCSLSRIGGGARVCVHANGPGPGYFGGGGKGCWMVGSGGGSTTL
jgi:hypothetical protein